ncbi:MAG: hypothetical protein M0036_04520 [Desulfobacteraceae bacterium]|nr:hypothetical protein [Desulfobacteraceae bacterium]
MSGGHFDYAQHKIGQIADEIQHLIDTNGSEETDAYGYKLGYSFPEEVIGKFREAVLTLRKAEIMAHRIDWLVSGDDGEEVFLQQWNEDLTKIAQRD